jgi:hypothetical protein
MPGVPAGNPPIAARTDIDESEDEPRLRPVLDPPPGPGSWSSRTLSDMQLFKEVASIAERGRIDTIFFGDSVGVPSTWRGSFDETVH